MIATWIGITYNILYLVGFTFALLFGCQPIKAYWYRLNFAWAASHDWHCDSENIGLPTSGALSVIGDFYSALLPMLLIMSLDLPRRQKLSLYALFALAFLVVGAGIARTVLVNTVINKDYDVCKLVPTLALDGPFLTCASSRGCCGKCGSGVRSSCMLPCLQQVPLLSNRSSGVSSLNL